ncbi:Porin-like protein NicP precursor [compost metagenome]
MAAKAKISKTQVAVGTVQPYLPILWRNDSRLLTQTFEGAYLQSEDVKDAKIQAGHLVSTRLRDSSGNSEMLAFADGITGVVKSDSFDFVGGNYTFSPTLSAAYYYSNLESNYDQHYVGLIHKLPITDKVTFSSQFRYFKSDNLGQTNVDNRYAGAMFTLYNGVHSVALGYQDLSGETGFPYVAGGADPYTFNSMLYSVFLRTNEKSWQAKYEFDFASVGLPGLSLVSRYVEGDGFKVAGQSAKESEVDVDLAYVVQSGPLQGLRFQWRTGKYWSDRLADGDENRFIVNYTYKFW